MDFLVQFLKVKLRRLDFKMVSFNGLLGWIVYQLSLLAVLMILVVALTNLVSLSIVLGQLILLEWFVSPTTLGSIVLGIVSLCRHCQISCQNQLPKSLN